jgi:catechol 2,3-dioxygenase-like lactoylglutathione lyase family enzyme
VRPYLRMRAFQGVEFTLETVSIYATSLPSYAASGNRLWGPVSERHIDPVRFRDALFPGLVVVLLGLAGLARAPRRFQAVAIAASAVAVVLSLGPETGVYRFLHENLVFLRGVRALGRFAVVPWLALTVLAGFCLAGRRWFVSMGALVLVMLESTNVPLRLGPYDGPPAYARWLAGKPGGVAALPLGMDDTQVMLDGIAHFRPLVNGDSGFMPRPYDRAMELLAREPLGEEGFRLLRAVGVTHLVARGPIDAALLADLDGRRLYEVPPGEVAHVVEAGARVSTRWDAEGVLADLGHERSVSGVTFEIADEEWVDRPLVRVSTDGQAWEDVPAEASLPDAVLSLYLDPRAGRGVVRFSPRAARFVRLDARLPARRGVLEALP